MIAADSSLGLSKGLAPHRLHFYLARGKKVGEPARSKQMSAQIPVYNVLPLLQRKLGAINFHARVNINMDESKTKLSVYWQIRLIGFQTECHTIFMKSKRFRLYFLMIILFFFLPRLFQYCFYAKSTLFITSCRSLASNNGM